MIPVVNSFNFTRPQHSFLNISNVSTINTASSDFALASTEYNLLRKRSFLWGDAKWGSKKHFVVE